MASRGSLLKEDSLEFWFKGPDFPKGPEDTWPSAFETTHEEVTLELKKTAQVNVTEVKKQPLDVWFSYHSQWTKMVKGVAWFRRWKAVHLVMMGKSNEVKVGGLQLHEIQSAEKDILRYVQRQSYPDEWEQIMERDGSSRRRLLRRSTIGKLNPIERNGLLCVGGRLSAATIPDDKKWPVILPRKHPSNRRDHMGSTQEGRSRRGKSHAGYLARTFLDSQR